MLTCISPHQEETIIITGGRILPGLSTVNEQSVEERQGWGLGFTLLQSSNFPHWAMLSKISIVGKINP